MMNSSILRCWAKVFSLASMRDSCFQCCGYCSGGSCTAACVRSTTVDEPGYTENRAGREQRHEVSCEAPRCDAKGRRHFVPHAHRQRLKINGEGGRCAIA